MAMQTKSICICDARSEDLRTMKYVFEFTKAMVPDRVWRALMRLEEKGKFYFPNVGDRGYHALLDGVHTNRLSNSDFQEFFDLAMDEDNEWPRKDSTREASMKLLANCSWLVDIVEE